MNEEICEWSQEEESYIWESDCGGTFILEDGGPEENKMKYCCFCGKPLVQTPWEE